MGEKQKYFLDSAGAVSFRPAISDLQAYLSLNRRSGLSVLFSRKGKTESFFTQDSQRYYTPEEYRRLQRGEKIFRPVRWIDGASAREMKESLDYSDELYRQLIERYSSFKNYWADLFQGTVQGMSVAKAWNLSIAGAIIFGMISMTMVYHYLGTSAAAKEKKAKTTTEEQGQVLGASDEKIDEGFLKLLTAENAENQKREEFEKEIRDLVKGSPIEQMVPEIAKQDRIIAALLVAIARKESSWGVHVPVLDGKDCYNYWGYRGIRDRMGTGGHTCFDSPKDAVDTVAKRLEFLVSNK
ncbi:MAG: hypothetical protein NTZ97_00900, partial [Candidatus Moranbacteria bacterium]|nr:hypothetical protein [Candidatus Moranbacteria bacterium]